MRCLVVILVTLSFAWLTAVTPPQGPKGWTPKQVTGVVQIPGLEKIKLP